MLVCQFANPEVWFCKYIRLASGFVVIPILHGMRFSASFYYQVDGDCKFYCYGKTEPGPHVYMCSAERDKNYDNPLMHTLGPTLSCCGMTISGG